MKKTVLFGLPLLLTMVLLSGCGTAPTTSDSNTVREVINKAVEEANKGGDTATVTDTNNTVDTTSCITGCAFLNGNGILSKDFCEQSCYVSEAEQTGNTTLCDTKVQDGLLKTGCYSAVAKKAGDVLICDKIGNDMNDIMRGSCYSAVAAEKKDPSVCDPIKNSLMYVGCIESAQENPQ